jgi:hypothetical protein
MTPIQRTQLGDVRGLATPGARLRAQTKDGRPVITGYAAVFNSLSEDLGGFREVIRPGAFAACLADAGLDVRAVFNHDPNLVLGRSTAGTLRLVEDAHGLSFEVEPPDTSWARDLMVSIARGDISQCSFRFYMFADPLRGQVWRAGSDGVIREITEFAEVDDVSVVTYPAYKATEVSLRSLESFRRSQQPSGPAGPAGNRAWLIQADMRIQLAAAGAAV